MTLPKDYRIASETALQGPWKNRLARSTSPYLLQHAHNPVDWFPWGEDAFNEARRRDVPVFLSIGYAACHWCHVMEHESFSDPAVAAVMNRDFVNIKVDREERPDVDALYMDAIHAMGRHGGWPASIWMTADGRPFFAGTYFPPNWRQGHPAFRSVLSQLSGGWSNDRERLLKGGDAITKKLQSAIPVSANQNISPHCVPRAFEDLQEHWDDASGGWGHGAKFPMPPSLDLLLRFGVIHRKPMAFVMLRKALDAMDAGGLHDHLGGGFHRYTVDPDWKVPHFEKMLYDNAQLLRTYARASVALDEPRYAQVAAGIVDYLERDLKLENGAYASSEDADSDGEEGTFYVWTRQEVHDRLHPAHAALFCRAYQIDSSGNFEHGTTVLNRSLQIQPDDPGLNEVRQKVLAIRNGRNRPARDDKAVVAWNALALSGLACGGQLLNRTDWIERARELAEILLDAPRRNGLLPRTLDESAPDGVLEDHAFLAEGLVDLYEATGEPEWLHHCVALLEAALPSFYDAEGGGFFRSANESLLVRQKSFEDGAEPSGMSRLVQTLLRLRSFGHPIGHHPGVESSLSAGAHALKIRPGSVPELLTAYERSSRPATQVVIAAADSQSANALTSVYREQIRPDAVLAHLRPKTSDLEAFTLFDNREVPSEGARAYVCLDYTCKLPVFDPESLRSALSDCEEMS